MSTHKFSELKAEMPPERRARVEARTKELLLTLPTPAQQKVYEVIAQHVAETGRGLSFQAIGDKLGGRSSATIWKHVRNLVKLELLKQSEGGRIIFMKADCCPTCGHRKTA